MQARRETPARERDPARHQVDGRRVSGMAVDDQNAIAPVPREAGKNVLEQGGERRLPQRHPARNGAEPVRPAEGDRRQDERLDPRGGGAFGHQRRKPVGEQEVAHRRVRPLLLEASHRQEQDRAAREALPHLGGGKLGEPDPKRRRLPRHRLSGGGRAPRERAPPHRRRSRPRRAGRRCCGASRSARARRRRCADAPPAPRRRSRRNPPPPCSGCP